MKNKKLHLELLRIIACFFVIFNHTGGRGHGLFETYPLGSAEYWLYMIPSVFCKFSVPLFLAISGALLIDREESLAVIFKKRVLKLAAVLLIFSLFYYLISLDSLSDISAYNFLGTMYTYTWCHPFWYLYRFIPFLLFLPFIRALAKNLKDCYFYYLFAILIIFESILPVAEYLLWKDAHTLYYHFDISWATSIIFIYPCLGYFIEKRLDISKIKKWLLPMWVLNIGCIFISCFMTFYQASIVGYNTQRFFSSFVLINVATLFISAKYCYSTRKREHKVMDRIVATIGGCTLGIYLVHAFFLLELPATERLWSFLLTGLDLNPMLAAFIVCIVVFVVCCIVALIMKKIPLLNRLI